MTRLFTLAAQVYSLRSEVALASTALRLRGGRRQRLSSALKRLQGVCEDLEVLSLSAPQEAPEGRRGEEEILQALDLAEAALAEAYEAAEEGCRASIAPYCAEALDSLRGLEEDLRRLLAEEGGGG